VLRSSDGKRRVEIRWDGRFLTLGDTRMSLFGDLTGGRGELRLFVDRSCVEVHAAGQCLTRVVPFHDGDQGVAVFAEGDGARIASLRAWELE